MAKSTDKGKPAAAEKPLAKPGWMCVVDGCEQPRAIGVICSGHAVNYHADGRAR